MNYLILLPLLLIGAEAAAEFDLLFEWKELSFSWPNETVKNESINAGNYIIENNPLYGFAHWKNKLFISVPRWKNGVAATLTYIDLNRSSEGSPDLIPYPDWESHDLQTYSSRSIVSVYRIHIDTCDRLWFLDTGVDGIQEITKVYGPATLKIIDLNTDKIIHKYVLKDSDQTPLSFFGSLVLDIDKDNCNDAYAYISDVIGYGLVVYSLSQNDSWRFSHNFFNFEPLLGNVFIGGVNFQWHDGIFGSALGSKEQDGYRTFYFHPLISYNEFSVNTRTLQNKSLAANNDYYLWKHEGFKGELAASLISIFDETTNTLITSQPLQAGIGCWNPTRNLSPDTFDLIAQDNKTLVFSNDFKIDETRNLWIISDKLPLFVVSKLNANETNYRILRVNLDDLLFGTACAV